MFNHFDSQFPSQLKQARKEKGLTQTELGEMLGVSKLSVCNWENGVKRPRVAKIQKLNEIFKEVFLKQQNIFLQTATTDQLIEEMRSRGWKFSMTK